MVKKQNNSTAIICYLLSIFMAISIDIYLPSLPSIAKSFNASSKEAQFTLNIFLLGFACSQIFYGAIADQFGKRTPLLIGLVLYCTSSIGCLFSTSISMLSFFRLLQSFGACSASVSAYAIARDTYDGKILTKILANMAIIMTIVPSIAPLGGSIIDKYIGWRFNFLILAIVSFATIFYVSKFLEKQSLCKKGFTLKTVFNDYINITKNNSYIYYTIISASAFLALYFFISSSPFILIQNLNMDVSHYGILMVINAMALVSGNQLSKILNSKFSISTCITIGTVIMIISSTFMLVSSSSSHSIMYFLFMLFSSIGIGIISPCAICGALQSQKSRSAQASAFSGFIRFSFAMLIATLLSPTLQITALVILACALLNLYLIYFTKQVSSQTGLNYEN